MRIYNKKMYLLNKLLLFGLILISFATIFTANHSKVYAHPLDLTDLYLYYAKESDDTSIPQNKISGYLYINWYQAGALVQESTGKDALSLEMEELAKYDDVYNSYVNENLKIFNNCKECESTFKSIAQDAYAYPLDLGKRIIVDFTCSENVQNLKIQNTLFLKEFEFSTNFVNLFRGEIFIEKVEMNRNYTEAEISINTDGSVDFKRPDNFISTNGYVSPLDPAYTDQNFDSAKSIMKEPSNQSFWQRIKNIGNVEDMNPLYLIVLLFILGFLHTMEAGHSKVVLTSAMIHKNMSIKGGIMYALVFTVTHIGDIVLLGLSLWVINNFIDVYSKFSMLERFASYALLFIGVYLLFKSISDLIKNRYLKESDHGHHHDHEHSHSHSHSHDFDPNKSFRDQLFVGFLTGLAPCVFGWSILMLIISAKKLWLLLPAILSFSLGIFTALVIVVFIIGKFRKRILDKIGWFTEISPILSAGILIVYAIYIIA